VREQQPTSKKLGDLFGRELPLSGFERQPSTFKLMLEDISSGGTLKREKRKRDYRSIRDWKMKD
jgi:hypothetical protein